MYELLGKPKMSVSSASTPGSNVELERQRKNENKAFHGNHNRRNAARNKQQKGMFWCLKIVYFPYET